MSRRWTVVLPLAVVLASPAARAQPPSASAEGDPLVARARAHIAAAEFEQAQLALDAALRAGGHRAGDTAALHGLAGVVAASLERPTEARDAFARQLAIAPGSAVDRQLGPKIVEPFAAARAALAGRSIAVSARAVAGGVELVVADDPLTMVVGVRAGVTADGAPLAVADVAAAPSGPAARADRRALLALPSAAPRTIVVSALDGHGNRLADLEVALPSADRRAERAPATAAEAPPRSRRWMISAGGAVGLAAIGGTFGALARSTRADLDAVLADRARHTRAEAEALDARGARQTLIANLSFAAAGLLAAGAIVDLLWLAPDRGVALVGAPARGGGVLLGVSGEL